ncbi:Zinc/iron permease [Atractiella rhizophila]|nr:Zinc/iron permease [Atractiella rhizophila]
MSSEDVNCGAAVAGGDLGAGRGLRIGAVFVIFSTSLIGVLFPIIARRSRRARIPESLYDFAKYFGSGVIIATAFIHLLDPAFEALGSPCLTGTWQEYPWAAALSMAAVFGIFIFELLAFRLGHAIAAGMAKEYDVHLSAHAAHGPEREGGHLHPHPPSLEAEESIVGTPPLASGSSSPPLAPPPSSRSSSISKTLDGETSTSTTAVPELVLPQGEGHARKHDHDHHGHERAEGHSHGHDDSSTFHSATQIIGVAILEFGVILHSAIIGLTLGVTDEFVPLFVVITFHQMFEALGLGTRLATLPLHRKSIIPWIAGIMYASTTPLTLGIGIGVRGSYNPESATASKVSGVLDAVSSGILLYTGLVELLGHEFLWNDGMRKAPLSKVLYAVFCCLTGAGIMASLGRWA